MKRLYVFIVLICFVFSTIIRPVFSSETIGEYTYTQENGTWYAEKNGIKERIYPKIIMVEFKKTALKDQIQQLIESLLMAV